MDDLVVAPGREGDAQRLVPVDHVLERRRQRTHVERPGEVQSERLVVGDGRVGVHPRQDPELLLGRGQRQDARRWRRGGSRPGARRHDRSLATGQQAGGGHLAHAPPHRIDEPVQILIGVGRRDEHRAPEASVDPLLHQVEIQKLGMAHSPRSEDTQDRATGRHRERHASGSELGVEPLGQARSPRVEPLLEGRPFGAQPGEHGPGRRQAQRVLREGAGEEGQLRFRHRVVAEAPGTAVEGVEELSTAGHHADRQAAAQHLAVGGQIRPHAEQAAGAGRVDPKAGDDLVEDERHARVVRDPPQLAQEIGRLEVRPPALHRLHQDRGQLAGARGDPLQGLRGAVIQDQDVAHHARQHPGRHGQRRAATAPLGEGAVESAVVGAGEEDDLRAPGRGARDPQRCHDGLGARGAEGGPLHTGQLADAARHLAGLRRARPQLHAGCELLVQRRGEEVRRMSEQMDAEPHVHVHVLVAVHVAEARAGRGPRHNRIDHLLPQAAEPGDCAVVGEDRPVGVGEPLGARRAGVVARDQLLDVPPRRVPKPFDWRGPDRLVGDVGGGGRPLTPGPSPIRPPFPRERGEGLAATFPVNSDFSPLSRGKGGRMGEGGRGGEGPTHQVEQPRHHPQVLAGDLFDSASRGRWSRVGHGRRSLDRRRIGRQHRVQMPGQRGRRGKILQQAAERNACAKALLDGTARLDQRQGVGAQVQEGGANGDVGCPASQQAGENLGDGGQQALAPLGGLLHEALLDDRILDPVAAAFKGIARQRHAPAVLGALEAAPVDAGPGAPQAAQGCEHPRLLGAALLCQRGEDTSCAPAAGQRAERPARPNLQEQAGRLGQQRVQPVCEAHRAAQVGGPIGRIGGLLVADPGAGHVGQIGDLRRRQLHLSHPPGERLEDRIHHGRMKGVRGAQTTAGDALFGEPALQPLDRRQRTGRDAALRRVDRGQGQPVLARQMLRESTLSERHGEHGAGREPLHETAALGDQGEGVLQRKDTGQAGCHVLPQAVAEEGFGDHPPVFPEAGERPLDREEGGLCNFGPVQALGGREQPAQIEAEMGREQLGAAVDPLLEAGLGGVQLRGGAGPLSPLARKEESDRPGSRGDSGRSAGAESGECLVPAAADHRPPVREGAAARAQGPGGVGERRSVEVRALLQMLPQATGGGVQRLFESARRAPGAARGVKGRRDRPPGPPPAPRGHWCRRPRRRSLPPRRGPLSDTHSARRALT